jgi:hypothetical protein
MPTTPTLPPPPEPPWTWRPLHRAPLDGSIVPVFDGRYLVTSTGFASGGTDLTVTESRTGRVRVRHDTPPGYAVQGAWLAARWMLVAETEYRPASYAIRLYRYDLATGAVDRLHDRLPAVAQPKLSVAGAVLAYVGGDRAGKQCLHRVVIDTLAVETAGCVPKGIVIGDPQVSADGTVTFNQSTQTRCKRLYRWPAGTATVLRIAAVRDCQQWSGAVVPGGEVWSETQPALRNVLYSRGYARDATGQRIDLGVILTDTIRPCRDWIYWNAPANHRPGGPEALYRWRPGRYVEQRLAPYRADAKPTAVNCSGDQITVRIDTLQPAGSAAFVHSAQ